MLINNGLWDITRKFTENLIRVLKFNNHAVAFEQEKV